MKKKKYLLLLVRKHSGEVDWILPVIYKLRSRFKLITIFNDIESYDSLKSNKKLFSLWKAISYKSLILKNKSNILLRLFYRLFSFLKIFKKLEKKILDRIYNINKILNKINIKLDLIAICFLTYNNYSYFPEYIKKKKSKVLVVRYPEATTPLHYDFQLPKNYRPYSKLYADIAIFSKRFEPKVIYENHDFINKKIIYSGYPRYESWWIKKMIDKKNKEKKVFRVFIATRSLDEARYNGKEAFEKNSDIYITKSIMKIIMSLKNSHAIFKPHPNVKNKYYLHDILKSYPKNKWSINSDHVLNLANQADICICIFTSACLDCLALKKPTVEFIKFKFPIQQTVLKKNSIEIMSIFSYFNIIKSIKNPKELAKYIYYYYHNKKIKYRNNIFKNFLKSNYDCRYVANYLTTRVKNC